MMTGPAGKWVLATLRWSCWCWSCCWRQVRKFYTALFLKSVCAKLTPKHQTYNIGVRACNFQWDFASVRNFERALGNSLEENVTDCLERLFNLWMRKIIEKSHCQWASAACARRHLINYHQRNCNYLLSRWRFAAASSLVAHSVSANFDDPQIKTRKSFYYTLRVF